MIDKWTKYQGPGYHVWNNRDKFFENFADEDKNKFHLWSILTVICHSPQPLTAEGVCNAWSSWCRPGGANKPNLQTLIYWIRKTKEKRKKRGHNQMLLGADRDAMIDLINRGYDHDAEDEDDLEILNTPKYQKKKKKMSEKKMDEGTGDNPNDQNYNDDDNDAAFDALMGFLREDDDKNADDDNKKDQQNKPKLNDIELKIHPTIQEILSERLGANQFEYVVEEMNRNLDGKYIEQVNN